jgi:hypothetical protein
MFTEILDQKFMDPRIGFSGRVHFKREDKSKKEDLFQFKMKKHCLYNAT